MRMFSIWLLALTALTTGCMGPRVEVPTAHVGKVLEPGGFEKDLRGPSTFRLPWNPLGLSPSRLVIAEASDQQIKEELDIFVPKDNLMTHIECRGTLAVASDGEHADAIFGRLKSKYFGPNIDIIDFDDVYLTYGSQIVQTMTRAIVTQHDINYVMSHREEISAELEKAIGERLKTTPIRLVHFGLSTVQPPQLIIDAQNTAKQTEVAIERAKADRLVKLTQAEAALEVAKKQQMVDLLEADTQRLVNLKLTEGVNIAFVQQRVLTTLEKIAKSDDRVMLIPQESIGNNALMTAVHQDSFRQFSEKQNQKGGNDE